MNYYYKSHEAKQEFITRTAIDIAGRLNYYFSLARIPKDCSRKIAIGNIQKELQDVENSIKALRLAAGVEIETPLNKDGYFIVNNLTMYHDCIEKRKD